jgi:hypothetical protein
MLSEQKGKWSRGEMCRGNGTNGRCEGRQAGSVRRIRGYMEQDQMVKRGPRKPLLLLQNGSPL